MWYHTCIVGSVLLHMTFSLPDFRHRTDLSIRHLDNESFSEYYLRDSGGFQRIEFINKPVNLNYFPKCCPPGYVYGTHQHNCTADQNTKFEYFELVARNVNLVKSGMADCEVIVDHLVPVDEFDVDDDTRTVSFYQNNIDFGRYCVDASSPGTREPMYIVRECKDKEYCLSNKHHDVCIKKCCPDGYQFINRKCTQDPTFGMDVGRYHGIIENYKGSFAVYYKPSSCKRYVWKHETGIAITQQGTFSMKTKTTDLQYPLDEEMYCIDGNMIPDENYSMSVFLLCANSGTEINFQISRICLLISCVCLFITVAIFIAISKVRTLMGKIVTSYSTIMFAAFLLLSTAQFMPDLGQLCKPIAYCILFAFTATFAWMNVMCYEIWKTLGVMKNGVPIEAQKRIFIKYNIYAWSIPAMLVSLIAFFNTTKVLPDKLHPFLGETHCLLENRIDQNMYGHTIFMVLPQVTMISINAVLFVLTLRHFWRLKHEEIKLQDNENTQAKKKRRKIQKYDVQRFAMVTKLFIIMGLSWVFEVVSAVIDFKQHPTWATIEIILDTFNCLQGVFIFCIFVLNKKTIRRLRNRCSFKSKRTVEEERFSSCTSSIYPAEQQEMTIQTIQA